MTPLTTCKALTFAFIPGSCKEFENIARTQKSVTVETVSELSFSRNYFYSALGCAALGFMGTSSTNFHLESQILKFAASGITLVGSLMMYNAAMRVQSVWNNRSLHC